MGVCECRGCGLSGGGGGWEGGGVWSVCRVGV